MACMTGSLSLIVLLLNGSPIGGERIAVDRASPEQLIARGWVPDVNSPNFVRSKAKLWNNMQDGDGYSSSAYNFAQGQYFEGETWENISSEISDAMNVNASFGAFSSSLAHSSEAITATTHRAQAIIWRMRAITVRVRLELDGDLKSRLKPNILKMIEDSSPAHIVDTVGMFYAEEMDLGGVLQSFFQQEDTTSQSHSNFSANVHANAAKWAAKVEATGNSKTQHNATGLTKQMNVRVAREGGDSLVWLEHGDPETLQNKWAATLSEENLFPVQLSLRPIWEVVEQVDPAKAIAVQQYLRDQWQQGQARLARLDSKPRPPKPPCHPWAGNTYKILIRGWQRDQLNQWLGWFYEGKRHTYYAAVRDEVDGIPFRFEAADECDSYHLQNVMPRPVSTGYPEPQYWNDHSWLSFGHCQWISGFHTHGDAMPIKFHAQGKRYIMQNVWPGRDEYFSYIENWNSRLASHACGRDRRAGSVRAGWSVDRAMTVSLHRQDQI